MLALCFAQRLTFRVTYRHTSAHQQTSRLPPGPHQTAHREQTFSVSCSSLSPELSRRSHLCEAGCPCCRCGSSNEARRAGRKSALCQDQGGEVS